MKFDNPIVKPGDYVRIFEFLNKESETSFKVARAPCAGRIIVEVGIKNLKDKDLVPGWYGREYPDIAVKYNLNPSKKYWNVSIWRLSQDRRLDV